MFDWHSNAKLPKNRLYIRDSLIKFCEIDTNPLSWRNCDQILFVFLKANVKQRAEDIHILLFLYSYLIARNDLYHGSRLGRYLPRMSHL